MGLQAILMFSVLTVSRAVIDKVDLGWSSGIGWTSLEFILWNAMELDGRDFQFILWNAVELDGRDYVTFPVHPLECSGNGWT